MRSTRKRSKKDACRREHVTDVNAISELDVEGTCVQKDLVSFVISLTLISVPRTVQRGVFILIYLVQLGFHPVAVVLP
jgi:hypothetical protein